MFEREIKVGRQGNEVVLYLFCTRFGRLGFGKYVFLALLHVARGGPLWLVLRFSNVILD